MKPENKALAITPGVRMIADFVEKGLGAVKNEPGSRFKFKSKQGTAPIGGTASVEFFTELGDEPLTARVHSMGIKNGLHIEYDHKGGYGTIAIDFDASRDECEAAAALLVENIRDEAVRQGLVAAAGAPAPKDAGSSVPRRRGHRGKAPAVALA